MDIKEQDLLGDGVDQHWYYTSKAAALSPFLKGQHITRILDVGAGSGFFSRHILSTTSAVEALCVDPHYEREWDEHVGEKPIHFRRTAQDFPADLVLLMDVLEHVNDDVALLKQSTEALKSGAKVIITVPAFPVLWSAHDLFLDHKRRYTISTLRPILEQAGLKIEKLSYGFGLLFPLVAAVRLAGRIKGPSSKPNSDLKVHHPLVNAALKFVCAMERPFMPYNKWAGLSLFCLAEKP
jgi:SAM-dependent methyltransferase